MNLLEDIINKVILEEDVEINDINDAIDNHKRVIINYHSKGEDNNTGARVIEVYAYGLTKAGNPVIRAFQPYGDTTSRVPSWKFFRLDRISAWKPTNQTFSKPADEYYKGLGDFNPNGDETMSIVYKIAKFGEEQTDNNLVTPQSRPKTKEEAQPEIYKTDTEKSLERLRQQVNNQIRLSDIKTKNGFRDFSKEEKPKEGPKTKADQYGIEDETNTEIENLENNLDTENPITFADLNDRLKAFDKYEKEKKKEQRNMTRRDNRWQKSVDKGYKNRKNSLNRAFDEDSLDNIVKETINKYLKKGRIII